MHLRFYAGASLKTAEGLPLGTVCVLDREPRQLRPDQLDALQALARQTMTQLELRRLLKVAQDSSRYRSRLMAIAGHDLRTPLRTAGYAIEKVRRTADEPSIKLLQVAKDSLSEIGQQFDELASVAGTESEFVAPDQIDMPISTVIDPVLSTWRRQAKIKGLQLRYVNSSLVVHSNRALLATLIGNLVGNAVKYTEQGSILIGCRRRQGSVVVNIIDTGIGMDDISAGKVFGAFRQANPHSEGLGLGLWIVRRTAETLGYTVEVASTPGKGTRFAITIPAAYRLLVRPSGRLLPCDAVLPATRGAAASQQGFSRRANPFGAMPQPRLPLLFPVVQRLAAVATGVDNLPRRPVSTRPEPVAGAVPRR
jgi:signal transduction histidine kinase